MFQRAVDLQTWADLFERLTDIHQSDLGSTMVTHARHPDLGAVVAIQDAAPDMLVLSELPISAGMDKPQGQELSLGKRNYDYAPTESYCKPYYSC